MYQVWAKNQSGSALSTTEIMIETNNEHFMGMVAVDKVNNSFSQFLQGKSQDFGA